ncbi:MAG TPA: hypothetical protein VMU05_18395 [Dongiaceae bacterium]|nr:hypothetical protein [Dongiaceae bacterium]
MDMFLLLLIGISITALLFTIVAAVKAMRVIGVQVQFRPLIRVTWPGVALLSAASATATAILFMALARALSLNLLIWMLMAGELCAISSIIVSAWAPQRVRRSALLAGAIWMLAFGLVMLNLY